MTREIGSVPAGDSQLLDDLIAAASSGAEQYCRRAFAREVLSETVVAYGGQHLRLSRTPVISVTSVLFDSEVITDYSIEDRELGLLYRRAGWYWTAQVTPGLTGRQRWPGFGHPMPGSEEARFTSAYVGGYILPPQYIEAATTISAAAADNSFRDSANGFPSLLKAGDMVESSGFTNPANNGRFKVTGTPTAGVIPVAATLTEEAAGQARSLRFQPPGECRVFDDVEKACIEIVKAWYLSKDEEGGIVEKQAGSLRLRRSELLGIATLPFPAQAVALLTPWVRHV